MKFRPIAVAVAALALAGNAFAQDTTSEKGKLSYALGYDLGRNAVESGEQVDINTVIKGLQDGYGKKQPAVPVDQLRTAVQNMQKRQADRAKAEWDKAAAENKGRNRDRFRRPRSCGDRIAWPERKCRRAENHPAADDGPEEPERRGRAAHSAGSCTGKLWAVLPQTVTPVRRATR